MTDEDRNTWDYVVCIPYEGAPFHILRVRPATRPATMEKMLAVKTDKGSFRLNQIAYIRFHARIGDREAARDKAREAGLVFIPPAIIKGHRDLAPDIKIKGIRDHYNKVTSFSGDVKKYLAEVQSHLDGIFGPGSQKAPKAPEFPFG